MFGAQAVTEALQGRCDEAWDLHKLEERASYRSRPIIIGHNRVCRWTDWIAWDLVVRFRISSSCRQQLPHFRQRLDRPGVPPLRPLEQFLAHLRPRTCTNPRPCRLGNAGNVRNCGFAQSMSRKTGKSSQETRQNSMQPLLIVRKAVSQRRCTPDFDARTELAQTVLGAS